MYFMIVNVRGGALYMEEKEREDKERKKDRDDDVDEGKNNGESWRVCNDGVPLACDGMMAVLLIPYQP